MSHLIEHEVQCAFCQHPNTVEVWSVINVNSDPELKDILLGGELNIVECEACRKTFYAEHFLLYHDPSAELMAFVYPLSNELQREEYEKQTQRNFETSQALADDAEKLAYTPITLFGLDALLRLVEREDEEVLQSEIVSLLAKQHDWPVITLKRSVARRLKLPPLLLGEKTVDGISMSPSITTLDQLMRVNDRLFIYGELLERLKKDPSMLGDVRG